MIDLILFGIILIIIAGFGWYVREHTKLENKLINAILSKTPQDLANLTFADQTKLQASANVPEPDLIPTDQMTDDEFMDTIHQQNLDEIGQDQEIV